jgi:hypothetical protein
MTLDDEKVKELAEKCASLAARWFVEVQHHADHIKRLTPQFETLLRAASAPVPGSVEVRVAVGYEQLPDGGASVTVYQVDSRRDEKAAMDCTFNASDTHRCIAVIHVPPVQAVPVVEASNH